MSPQCDKNISIFYLKNWCQSVTLCISHSWQSATYGQEYKGNHVAYSGHCIPVSADSKSSAHQDIPVWSSQRLHRQQSPVNFSSHNSSMLTQVRFFLPYQPNQPYQWYHTIPAMLTIPSAPINHTIYINISYRCRDDPLCFASSVNGGQCQEHGEDVPMSALNNVWIERGKKLMNS